MRKLRGFKTYHLKKLEDPEEARLYLTAALEDYEEDQDTEAFLLAIRDVAEVQGGLSQLAKRTHLNRQNLYTALSKKGNPKLDTIGAILHGLGFRLSIEHLNFSSSQHSA